MFLLALLLAVAFLLLLTIYLLVVYFSNEPRPLSDDERMFNDIRTGKQLKFPSLKQQGSTADVYLSIVIPAYNEEHRLPSMLDQTLEYLENRRRLSAEQSFTFEVLIVDDGSRDGTADTAINWATHRMKLKWPKLSMDMSPCDIRVLRFKRNRGKGGAVTQGVICARGKYIIFADADGASKIDDLELLEERILEAEAKGQDCIAIGSRAHLVSTEAVVKRSAIRNFLMYAFHTFVFLLSSPGVRGIKDTQCGFKMFSRSTARKIFPFMHVEGWIFDIEVLHLASSKRIRIDEVAINWQEVEGSKMNLITDSLKMAVDLFVIRFNYATGRWSYKFPQRRKSE